MRAHLSLAIVCLILGLAGCERDDQIVTYTTPKESARQASPVMPTAAQEPQAPGEIQWTVPKGWTQLPGKSFRFASFQIWPDHPEVQVTVIPLGPEAGNLLQNVNRWEGELGLPPTSGADLPKVVKRVTDEISAVDLASIDAAKKPMRTLAAIMPRPDRVWFFKLMGPADLIATQKDNFDAFVGSIHFGTAGPATPAGEGVAGATWKVPAGWAKQPDRPMRLATYAAGQTELVITQFAQDNTGALLPNINRWRQQVGLEQVDDPKKAASEAINVAGNDGVVFDFTGPQKKRTRVVMVPSGSAYWFFRLNGDSAAIDEQKPAFDDFLKSVQFGQQK